MKIRVLFILLSQLFAGCDIIPDKNSDTNDVPEVFNYDNLEGIMAFSRSNGKIIILDGHKKTDTTLVTENKANIWDASLCLSADGSNITYSASTNEGYQVFKMSVNGSNNLKLTRASSGFAEHFMCPVWSSDGDHIYYVANSLIILGPVFSIKPDGSELKQITKFDVYRRISVSKDKSFIVYASSLYPFGTVQGIYLYFIQNDSVKQIRTYDSNYIAYSPALSPDETKIAYVLRSGSNEQSPSSYFLRIMTINIDGTDERLVTELSFTTATETYVTWSPDGTKLAFNSGSGVISDQGSHIYIINPDGTGLVQVTHNTDYDGAPSWIK